MRFFASFALACLTAAAAQAALFSTPGPLAGLTAPEPAPVEMVVRGPMVEIVKKCPSLRYLGRDATFEIVVTNKGDGAASNVVVTDAISNNVEFLSADNGGTRQGNNVVWNLGSLDAGASRTLTVTVRCNQIGTVTNNARVTWCAEAAAGCEMEVKGIPAILLECVDDPDPIEIGSQTTYTIVVTNQGTAVGTNIAITCTLPAELDFVSADGPTRGTAEGKTITFAPVPTLAPKANVTFKVVVKGNKEGDVRFRVSLKSDQIATPVEETESTNVY